MGPGLKKRRAAFTKRTPLFRQPLCQYGAAHPAGARASPPHLRDAGLFFPTTGKKAAQGGLLSGRWQASPPPGRSGRPDRHLWLRRRGSAPAAAAKYYILPLQFLQFSRWYPHRPRRRAAPPGGSARAAGKRRYTYQYMRDRPGYVPIFACPDKKISGALLRAVFPLLFYLPHI